MRTRYNAGIFKHYSSAAMSEAQQFIDECEAETAQIMERLAEGGLSYIQVQDEVRMLVARIKGLKEALEEVEK